MFPDRHLLGEFVRPEWHRSGHEPFATALAQQRTRRWPRLFGSRTTRRGPRVRRDQTM
jgi:hypothetical protein